MTSSNTHSALPAWAIPLAAVSALLLVIFVALGIIGGPEKTEVGTTPAAVNSVPSGARTYRVSLAGADRLLEWQGVVRSRQAVKISPKFSARIVEIPVKVGDRLKKGEVIAKLDDRDPRAAYSAAVSAQAAAQAQAVQAAADEKRASELFEKQAATRQSYDAALARAKAARALAEQAASSARQSQVMMAENVLYAPFDGVVGERYQDPGDMGAPGQALVSFHQPDALRLEVSVASTCSGRIGLGDIAAVRIDGVDLIGRVAELAPEVDPQTRTRLVKVDLPATPGLQHGQFATLALPCDTAESALLIPAGAVLNFGQLQAVRVVENGAWHIRHIRTGKRYGDRLEVLTGLRDGETILADSELAL
ncbi:efflux transporter periplasmic adaptor subunit [Methylomonas sp. LWB]|uniref:efflux RND transporter periplasmic adaptor subunit n=1 Tax=Methylomonas sp. LWB TaxID=1905845 RepID=UPI0008DAA164|nr:efflux RND transporter periplasmic adaptor subunit [Methylomonas sp. LWB]OHX37788.1 efflux transporter periplasmic adaptor subunit [Methylomonas sp. LWB]